VTGTGKHRLAGSRQAEGGVRHGRREPAASRETGHIDQVSGVEGCGLGGLGAEPLGGILDAESAAGPVQRDSPAQVYPMAKRDVRLVAKQAANGADGQPERIRRRGFLDRHLRHGREEHVGSGQLAEGVEEGGDVGANPYFGVDQRAVVLTRLLGGGGAHGAVYQGKIQGDVGWGFPDRVDDALDFHPLPIGLASDHLIEARAGNLLGRGASPMMRICA